MPSTSFTGNCLNKDGDHGNFSGEKVNSPEECHERCKKEMDCVAFGISATISNYCYLYAKGPYTKGDGSSCCTCYVMPGTT